MADKLIKPTEVSSEVKSSDAYQNGLTIGAAIQSFANHTQATVATSLMIANSGIMDKNLKAME